MSNHKNDSLNMKLISEKNDATNMKSTINVKEKIIYELTPEMCYLILKNISDENHIIMEMTFNP